MTALATIFALTPMALGITGHGGFISQPLAIVVIGGLVSSTVLTLLVLPTLYNLVEGAKERRAVAAAGSSEEPDAAPGDARAGLVGAGAAGAAGHVLTRRELRAREAAASAAGTVVAADAADVDVPPPRSKDRTRDAGGATTAVVWVPTTSSPRPGADESQTGIDDASVEPQNSGLG